MKQILRLLSGLALSVLSSAFTPKRSQTAVGRWGRNRRSPAHVGVDYNSACRPQATNLHKALNHNAACMRTAIFIIKAPLNSWTESEQEYFSVTGENEAQRNKEAHRADKQTESNCGKNPRKSEFAAAPEFKWSSPCPGKVSLSVHAVFFFPHIYSVMTRSHLAAAQTAAPPPRKDYVSRNSFPF